MVTTPDEVDGYYDLGAFGRPVTTSSDEAQRWFDRGLNWLYGFNHAEAISCFGRAAEADDSCAMAHWGIAIALGPNYNLPWDLMDDVNRARVLAGAYDATQAALARRDGVSEVERDLIEALPARYPQRDPADDQMPWNHAFTEAMRAVLQRHPDDLDVAAVFVDAMLNETPWKMWDLETGGVATGARTVEAREVLESAFDGSPASWEHPGLLHLYVHLMEMSPFPEHALRAGDRLRELHEGAEVPE